MLLLFHDALATGAHLGIEATTAKLLEKCWWPGCENDVRRWVQTCKACRMCKPSAALSSEARTELHDRPFKVLFVDSVGPIYPQSRGFAYVLHAECPFTRFTWLKAVEKDDDHTWAVFLLEEVMFDLCGFPLVLRSDRGAPFVSRLVAEINQLLGVTHAFGSAYHPQSQGYIEARHKLINNVLRIYVQEIGEIWGWCISRQLSGR